MICLLYFEYVNKHIIIIIIIKCLKPYIYGSNRTMVIQNGNYMNMQFRSIIIHVQVRTISTLFRVRTLHIVALQDPNTTTSS